MDLLLRILVVLGALAPVGSPQSLFADELGDRIALKLDACDPADIRELASLRTPRAAERLVQLYERMETLYGRRLVARSLASFDGAEGAAGIALGKLRSIASESAVRELREEALDALARCRLGGGLYLRELVEAPAHDEVRVRAMRELVADPRDADLEWYRALWEPAPDLHGGTPRAEAPGETRRARRLPEVRALAFSVIAASLEPEQLQRAFYDRQREIRERALGELVERGVPGIDELLERAYSDREEWPRIRAAAAAGLVKSEGKAALKRFVRDGSRPNEPFGLRRALARLVAEELTPELAARVQRLVRDRDAEARDFALQVLTRARWGGASAAARRMLEDDDALVRGAACDALRTLEARDAEPELEALLAAERMPSVAGAAFDALASMRANDPDWPAYLAELLDGKVSETARNAALVALGSTRDPRYLAPLVGALDADSWSTRRAALRGLEALRSEYAVGVLVRRLGEEHGRLAREVADALWRLTGQPFGTDARAWQKWWIQELGRFRIPTEGELALAFTEARHRRERMRTRAEFFGIRIESTRVAFVIDVSGSMAEPTAGRYAGETGPPRLEVAKAELLRALGAMRAPARFRIISFASSPHAWRKRLVELTPDSFARAREHIEGLGLLGGTDLFSALELALDDPEVDTLYVLSDGEPFGAEVSDPEEIRLRIAARNAHRGVVLNCVAVGGALDLLEGLAADSGGTYVRVP